jgi:hypothetical protein
MATASAPARTSPAAKYDAQVAAQLSRAERRVRLLDLATGLLGFLAISLAFAAIMVVLHWNFQLSTTARQIGLVVYLLGAGAFLTWRVVLPLRRPINPRYAALQLERILPGSKNSVVNYVDLRNEDLPPAIRGAIGRRAAKDAVQVDVEQAIPGKYAGVAGAMAGAVAFTCLVLMFAIGIGDFFRLLGGVLAPMRPASVTPHVQQNRITVRLPEGGDASVAAGSAIDFAVRVSGDLPAGEDQAPKLTLTYAQSKDPVVRSMVKPRTPGSDWTAVVSALEVRDGFTYKVTAGDAETPTYQISVLFTPAVTRFQAVYRYRDYVGQPKIKVQVDNRRLQAWRGTEVALRVQTNGPVENAQVVMNWKDGKTELIEATRAADDPEAFEARFILKEAGTYRLRFTPTRGDRYQDPLGHELIADPDKPPHKVELTKPGFDIRLPANGLLKVEGTAEDDVGVKSLTLRMKIDGRDQQLKAKPYRSDDELRLPGGGYLKTLAYKDAVDLANVRDEKGNPLKAGDVIEYWLEARDACDFPGPNPATESKHFHVTLTEPEKDPAKQKRDREDARNEQQKHEDQQDEQRRQEDQKRKDQQKQAEEEQKNQGDSGKPNEPKGDKGSEKGDTRNEFNRDEQNAKNNLDKQREENERRAAESGESNDPKPPDKPNEKSDPKGAAKGDKPNPGDSKPAESKQGGSDADQKPNDRGDGKPEPNKSEQQKAGQCKKCNNPGGQQGDGKDGGMGGAMDGAKAAGKGGSSPNDPMSQGSENAAEAKNDSTPKPNPAANAGDGKGDDPKGGGAQAARGKPGGDMSAQPDAKPQGKEAGSEGKVADGKQAGNAKQQPAKGGPPDATAKEDPTKQMGNTGQPTAKGDGSGGKAGPQDQGGTKPAPQKGADQQTANAKNKRDDGGDLSKIDAKKASKDDLRNLLKALEKGDDKQAEKALEKMKEIGEKAEDPNAKEFAKDFMKDLEKNFENERDKEQKLAAQPRAGKQPPPGGPPEEQPGETKNGPGDNPKDLGTPKEGAGDPMMKRGTPKGAGRNTQTGDPIMPPDGMENTNDPTNATVKGPKVLIGRNDQSADARHDEPPKPGEPRNPLKNPNTTLQLEPFRPDKYRDREDQVLAKKDPRKGTNPGPNTGTPENPDPSSSGTLPSTVGRKTDPSTTSTDPIEAGRAVPAPGYRKAVAEFTKIRAQPEPDKKDQK